MLLRKNGRHSIAKCKIFEYIKIIFSEIIRSWDLIFWGFTSISIYVARVWWIYAIGRLCWVIYGSIKCPADLWILWILTHFSKCIYQMVAHWSIYQMRCIIDQTCRSIKRSWHIYIYILDTQNLKISKIF